MHVSVCVHMHKMTYTSCGQIHLCGRRLCLPNTDPGLSLLVVLVIAEAHQLLRRLHSLAEASFEENGLRIENMPPLPGRLAEGRPATQGG